MACEGGNQTFGVPTHPIDTGLSRLEMAVWAKTAGPFTRVLVFTLAWMFVLFFTRTTSHVHQNGQDEASCQVCQAAHIAPAPLAVSAAPYTLIALEYVRPDTLTFDLELFFGDCDSRGPPSHSVTR